MQNVVKKFKDKLENISSKLKIKNKPKVWTRDEKIRKWKINPIEPTSE